MKRNPFLIFIFLSATITSTYSQERAFDFWVGEWDIEWQGGKGTNTITKILDGKVIREQFSGERSMPLRGISLSLFDKNSGKWKQTWVDNSGSYLDFIGEFKENKMILHRTVVIKSVPTIQRMVWYNISSGSLDWNWETSVNQGKTWDILWKIHYVKTPATQVITKE